MLDLGEMISVILNDPVGFFVVFLKYLVILGIILLADRAGSSPHG
jgi:hypothetical protein